MWITKEYDWGTLKYEASYTDLQYIAHSKERAVIDSGLVSLQPKDSLDKTIELLANRIANKVQRKFAERH